MNVKDIFSLAVIIACSINTLYITNDFNIGWYSLIGWIPAWMFTIFRLNEQRFDIEEPKGEVIE